MKYYPPYGSTDPNAPYIDKDTASAVRGSVPPAAAIENPMREIVDVIAAAGLTPSDGLQLLSALQRLGLASATRARSWMSVLSMTLSSAPGSPSVGDAYLIPAGASGIWAANVGKIAEYTGASWTYLTPPNGHGISLPDGRVFERIGGSYVEKIAFDTQSGKWNFAGAGGTATSITVALNPAPVSLPDGMVITVLTAFAAAGPTTINVNGLGAVNVFSQAGTLIKQGDWPSAVPVQFIRRGSAWFLQSVSLGDVKAYADLNLAALRVYQSTSTFAVQVPSRSTRCMFQVWAPGGGGGSSVSVSGAAASGGGGGEYRHGILEGLTPGETLTCIVGSAGLGGMSGQDNGTVGGTSYIRKSDGITNLVIAIGGGGGYGSGAGLVTSYGTGGAAGTGGFGIDGDQGELPQNYGSIGPGLVGGRGGASFATSVRAVFGATSGGGAAAGAVGRPYGGGGCGGINGGRGGNGGSGMTIIAFLP
ncbi:hypothetical protein H4S14_000816 [Agrobacterium vitis]|nr:hypothetical protein [Agrobacterium vitis]MBE1437089.1 hypothetical protein [Agrobacterium vitis]